MFLKQQQKFNSGGKKMKNVTYQVPNISCGHCVNAIEMELSELSGVITIKANTDTRSVDIEYQDPATEELILETLQEINYPAAL
jgi:copper chaperone CopZ